MIITLNAPQLGDYWDTNTGNRVTGPLQANGEVEWRNGLANGQFLVFGAGIRCRDLTVHQLSGQCAIVDSVIYLNDVTASLNEQDFISANGIFDSRPPFQYRGKLTANLADLAVFNPLVQASGNDRRIGGSLAIDWNGSGAIRGRNAGTLKLTLENGRYGEAQALQANVDASYSPDGLNIPVIFLRSDKMDFQANAQTRGETLEISKIQLNQGAQKYADGYVSVPFVWNNIGTSKSPFVTDGPVTATFQTENLDIKKTFEDVGAKAPASGTANVKFQASGTLSELNADLAIQMRDLRSATIPKLEPASVNLTAQAHNNQLTINGSVQQPKIQPITLTGVLPFRTSEILQQGKVPEDTPVKAQVRLPRSSVNFVRQFVPAVEELDGDVALDVSVDGTIARPVLSGSGDMTINVGRFTNATLPALQNFKARMVFNRDTLSLERFGGELAGGPFSVSGRVTFPKLTQPNLDFQLKANSVLVARNDSVTARADADIRVAGPLSSATVTGNVALTNSHFLKNLDLIPIGLPGRPAPEPPPSRPQFSIPDPPVRDWKFDVAIKTKDPFLIRGSIANGGAIVDLHLGGTGLKPLLDGQIRLENVEATLPFSRLDVQYGFLYFDPSDPLNPKMDLHGSSVIRDYTIHVYVYGRSLSPEAVFTSEPPLPQEEIISLLATGTTRQELTGNNNVLAGRAAMLLFQQLYRKVFKKGENTKSNSVFDRLDIDIGQVDPRTGQQRATARYKVNQQIVLVGDIEVGGDFRGMVKYLIRFR
jgi:TamB, inner membrane protein subunit of TAM complex